VLLPELGDTAVIHSGMGTLTREHGASPWERINWTHGTYSAVEICLLTIFVALWGSFDTFTRLSPGSALARRKKTNCKSTS